MDNMSETEAVTERISRDFYGGKMPYVVYMIIDKCRFEYKFEPEVCYKLFEECYNHDMSRKFESIKALADSWYNQGLTDINSVNQHIYRPAEKESMEHLVGRLMRKRLNSLDCEKVNRWVREYNYSQDIVVYAFERNEWRTNLSIAHVDSTLNKWYKAGVKTLDDAKKFDKKEYQENIVKKRERERENKAFAKLNSSPSLAARMVELDKEVSALSQRVSELEKELAELKAGKKIY